MARSHRRAYGISQPLVSGQQRVRASRHNEPQKVRVRRVVEKDGKIVVTHEWVPVTNPVNVKVAAGPTGQHGKINGGGKGRYEGDTYSVPSWWDGK